MRHAAHEGYFCRACADMDEIGAIAHGLWVVEDAAQALLSTYRGRPAGALGDLGCFSFHASKNIVAGEGGALTINHSDFAERAYVVAEREPIDELLRWTWTAAFLLAQLEEQKASLQLDLRFGIATTKALPNLKHAKPCDGRSSLQSADIMPSNELRDAMIAQLACLGVKAPFHYIPLHSAPAGKRYGRTVGSLSVTEDLSARLLRLPLFWDIDGLADEVIDRVYSAWAAIAPASQAKLSEKQNAFAPNEPS